jgi:hypothetical protein
VPFVQLYITESAYSVELEAKLTIACEEIVASALNVEKDEGNLSPFDIIVIPQRLEHMPLDVVIDIEAMPFPGREVGKEIMTEAILGSVNLLLEKDLRIGVGLKLVLHAWASTSDDAEPYGESMTLDAALNRARLRIKELEDTVFSDTELDT